MNVLLNVIIGLYFLMNVTPGEGNFVKTPDDITACAGGDILLDWQFSGSPTVVTWSKLPSTTVLTYVSIVGLATAGSGYEGRVKYNSNGNVTLRSVTEADSGTYECSLTYMLGVSEDNVAVQIYNVMKGSPVIDYHPSSNTLTCSVPDVVIGVTYSWTLRSSPIGTGQSIRPTESGDYTCSVSGQAVDRCMRAGIVNKATFSLVLEKPVVATTQSKINTAEGQSITFECFVESAKPSIITEWRWYRTGNEWNTLSHSSSYTIEYVTKDHAGTYACKASNIAGDSDAVSMAVNVYVPPVIAPFTNKSPKEGSTLLLLCNVTGNPVPTKNQVYWTKQDSPSFTVFGWYLSFSNISRQDRGIYTCHANTSLELSSGQLVWKANSKDVIVDVMYGPGNSVALSSVSPSMYYNETDPVQPVRCSATCSPNCTYTWTNPGGVSTLGSTLDLGKAAREMNGTYTCTAKTDIQSQTYRAEVSVHIFVYYAASVISTNHWDKVESLEGRDTILTCQTDGYPSPDISWTKDNETMRMSTTQFVTEDSLVLRNITRLDAGTYQCLVYNGIGESISVEFELKVLYGPGDSLQISEPSDTITFKEQEEILPINCSATCSPVCEFQWVYPNETIVQGATLNLRFATREMNGTYTCNAENKILSQKHSTNITITVLVYYSATIESSPHESSLSVKQGYDVTLSCSYDGYPFPSVTWYKNNSVVAANGFLNSGSISLLYLSNVKCEDSDVYTCEAYNGIGNPTRDTVSLYVESCSTPPSDMDVNKNISKKLIRTESHEEQLIPVYIGAATGSFVLLVVIIVVISIVCFTRRKRCKSPVRSSQIPPSAFPHEDHYYATVSSIQMAQIHQSDDTLYIHSISDDDYTSRNRSGSYTSSGSSYFSFGPTHQDITVSQRNNYTST